MANTELEDVAEKIRGLPPEEKLELAAALIRAGNLALARSVVGLVDAELASRIFARRFSR